MKRRSTYERPASDFGDRLRTGGLVAVILICVFVLGLMTGTVAPLH